MQAVTKFLKQKMDLFLSFIVTIEFTVVLFDSGGYFGNACFWLLIVNCLISIFLFILFKRIFISWSVIFCLILSLLYILSACISNGIVYSEAGIICKVLCLGWFCVLLAQTNDIVKKNILWLLTLIGICCSIIGILVYLKLFNFVNGVVVSRLSFPVQYANTAGILYNIFIFLCIYNLKSWKKLACLLPLCCLILTKSYGAIIVCVLVSIINVFYLLYKKKSLPKFSVIIFSITLFILSIICLIICFNFSDTFVDRIIQIIDGSKLLISNLFGVGPDMWQYNYNNIQSAQYTARFIHCGYLHLMLNGGILASICFIAWIILSMRKSIKLNKINFGVLSCCLLILLHACFDIDFEYFIIWMLLCILLNHSIELDNKKSCIFIVGLFILSLIFNVTYKTVDLDNYENELLLNDPTYRKEYTLEHYAILPNEVLSSEEAMYVSDVLMHDNRVNDACQLLLYWAKKETYNVKLYKYILSFNEKNNVLYNYQEQFNFALKKFNNNIEEPNSNLLKSQVKLP